MKGIGICNNTLIHTYYVDPEQVLEEEEKRDSYIQ